MKLYMELCIDKSFVKVMFLLRKNVKYDSAVLEIFWITNSGDRREV